jgi:hypothetical protein
VVYQLSKHQTVENIARVVGGMLEHNKIEKISKDGMINKNLIN